MCVGRAPTAARFFTWLCGTASIFPPCRWRSSRIKIPSQMRTGWYWFIPISLSTVGSSCSNLPRLNSKIFQGCDGSWTSHLTFLKNQLHLAISTWKGREWQNWKSLFEAGSSRSISKDLMRDANLKIKLKDSCFISEIHWNPLYLLE